MRSDSVVEDDNAFYEEELYEDNYTEDEEEEELEESYEEYDEYSADYDVYVITNLLTLH